MSHRSVASGHAGDGRWRASGSRSSSRGRTTAAGAAHARLARHAPALAAPGRGAERRPATARSRPTCAASATPTSPRRSRPTSSRTRVADMVAVLDACDVDQATVVAHDWGAVAAWGLAAFVPDRVERLAALSVGHPKAFSDAGFEQRMRSLYMLLFNLPVVAEQWLAMFGPQMLASHKDRDAVIAELERPGALTASFGWYRANAHPRTIINPPPELPPIRCPVMGVWSSRRHRADREADDRVAGVRRGLVALRADRGRRATGCSSTPPTSSTGCCWTSWPDRVGADASRAQVCAPILAAAATSRVTRRARCPRSGAAGRPVPSRSATAPLAAAAPAGTRGTRTAPPRGTRRAASR